MKYLFSAERFFLSLFTYRVLTIDLTDFKELSGPIKGIMIEEMLKLWKWLGKRSMEVS